MDTLQEVKNKVKSIVFEGVVQKSYILKEESNTFELSDNTDVNFIYWELWDKKRKEIVATGSGEKANIQLNKRLFGSYSYFLYASYYCLQAKRMISLTPVELSGECDPLVVAVSVSNKKISPGEELKIIFDLEGLNNDSLTLELISEKSKNTKKETCIEGNLIFHLEGSDTKKWKTGKDKNMRLTGKLKNSKGKYVLYHGKEEVFTINIQQEESNSDIKAETAQNKTIASININEPIVLKVTNEVLEMDGKNPSETKVCEKLLFKAIFREDKTEEPTQNNNIRWKVLIGDEEFKLEDILVEGSRLRSVASRFNLLKNYEQKIQLTGNEIYFPIPKEWGRKKIKLKAYTLNGAEATSPEIEVLDHFVAAFYRLKADQPTTFYVKDIKLGGGTDNMLKREPVYHVQGIFKDLDSGVMHVSVSTGNKVPAYVYVLDPDGGIDKYKFRKVNYFKNNYINNYTHPGGIQSSKGILGVGFEMYTDLDTHTTDRSILAFWDVEEEKNGAYKELEEIRIIKDPLVPNIDCEMKIYSSNLKEGRDFASATGILFMEKVEVKQGDKTNKDEFDKWLVASRGGNNSIDFYSISKDRLTVSPIGKKDVQVGNFQNVNLVADEEDRIYMIGFESTKGIFGKGTKTNFAWLYKIELTKPSETIDSPTSSDFNSVEINPAWINEFGEICEGKKRTTIRKGVSEKLTDKNVLKVTTQDLASFQWASCLYSEKTEMKKGYTDKLTMFAVGSSVEYDEDYEQKRKLAERDYKLYRQEEEQQLQSLYDFSYGVDEEELDDDQGIMSFEEFFRQGNYIVPVNTKIHFNYFTE